MSQGERRLDLVSFGEALVDFFPERPGEPLHEAERFTRHLGGAPANVAVGVARLGLRSALLGRVGDDPFGCFVRGALAREGIDARALRTDPTARTGITFVSVAADGQRSFTFYRHPSADQLVEPDDVDAALVGAARVLHFGSSTLAREPGRAATWRAVDVGAAAGAILSCDPNWRPHLWPDTAEAPARIREAIGRCHVVKVSAEEAEPIVGTADPQRAAHRLRELGPALVVVTTGAAGCRFECPGGGGTVAAPPVQVVDTTGAGDGFVAGLLAALLELLPPGAGPAELASLDAGRAGRACAYANRVAALTCARMGATAALPRRDEVGAP